MSEQLTLNLDAPCIRFAEPGELDYTAKTSAVCWTSEYGYDMVMPVEEGDCWDNDLLRKMHRWESAYHARAEHDKKRPFLKPVPWWRKLVA